jgi:TM2 domain-containing membrane protein YozV
MSHVSNLTSTFTAVFLCADKLKKFLPAFLFLFFSLAVNANERFSIEIPKDTNQIDSVQSKEPHKKFAVKKENKKLVAAILAFPVPFGFLGLHRIYLGTDPWVPVIYLVTFGGGMILPLIDFVAIICANKEEMKKYEGNGKLFMWID